MYKKEQASRLIQLLRDIEETVTVLNGFHRYPIGSSLSDGKRILRERRERDERRCIQGRLRALQKRRDIVVQRRREGYFVALTATGKVRINWLKLQEMPVRPDGQSVYILFDIPESARSVRDHFRRRLKSCGVEQVQRSVWSTNRDMADILRDQVVLLGVKQWVRIIVGRDLS